MSVQMIYNYHSLGMDISPQKGTQRQAVKSSWEGTAQAVGMNPSTSVREAAGTADAEPLELNRLRRGKAPFGLFW